MKRVLLCVCTIHACCHIILLLVISYLTVVTKRLAKTKTARGQAPRDVHIRNDANISHRTLFLKLSSDFSTCTR
jgi:hypothetical protein